MMAHAHVSHRANELMKEPVKKRQPVPRYMTVVVVYVMKLDTD